MKYWVIPSAVVVLIIAAISIQRRIERQNVERSIEAAETNFNQLLFENARSSSQQILQRDPANLRALQIAALSSAAVGDVASGTRYLQQIPRESRGWIARQSLQIGKISLQNGFARRAENFSRLGLEAEGQSPDLLSLLAYLLAVEGRAVEAAPFYRQLIELDVLDANSLLIVGASDQILLQLPDFKDRCLRADPDDALPLLAIARRAIADGESTSAESDLRRITRQEPGQIEAQVRLGRLILDKQDDREFLEWDQAVATAADWHPEIWVNRGLYALRQKQPQVAIRCFREAIAVDPNCTLPHEQLSGLLSEQAQPELASKFQRRAAKLSQLGSSMNQFNAKYELKLIREIAESCESLGRPREALAWAQYAIKKQTDFEWAQEFAGRIRQQHSPVVPWLLPEAVLAELIPVDQYPLPDWNAGAGQLMGTDSQN